MIPRASPPNFKGQRHLDSMQLLTSHNRDQLQELLDICNQQKHNLGDRARVLRMISKASSFIKGKEKDSGAVSQEAFRLYKQLTKISCKEEDIKDDDYDLLVYGLHK